MTQTPTNPTEDRRDGDSDALWWPEGRLKRIMRVFFYGIVLYHLVMSIGEMTAIA